MMTRKEAAMNLIQTDRIDPQDFLRFRTIVGWTPIAMEQIENGLRNSAKMICLKDGDEVVAMARLVWDGGYQAQLCDVMVLPAYQRQGLGRLMVTTLVDWLREQMKPGWSIKLNLSAAEGKEPFYEKLGFRRRPCDGAGSGMDQWLK